jgi:hypothetical protein
VEVRIFAVNSLDAVQHISKSSAELAQLCRTLKKIIARSAVSHPPDINFIAQNRLNSRGNERAA